LSLTEAREVVWSPGDGNEVVAEEKLGGSSAQARIEGVKGAGMTGRAGSFYRCNRSVGEATTSELREVQKYRHYAGKVKEGY
jgi:hypothetical protein